MFRPRHPPLALLLLMLSTLMPGPASASIGCYVGEVQVLPAQTGQSPPAVVNGYYNLCIAVEATGTVYAGTTPVASVDIKLFAGIATNDANSSCAEIITLFETATAPTFLTVKAAYCCYTQACNSPDKAIVTDGPLPSNFTPPPVSFSRPPPLARAPSPPPRANRTSPPPTTASPSPHANGSLPVPSGNATLTPPPHANLTAPPPRAASPLPPLPRALSPPLPAKRHPPPKLKHHKPPPPCKKSHHMPSAATIRHGRRMV